MTIKRNYLPYSLEHDGVTGHDDYLTSSRHFLEN